MNSFYDEALLRMGLPLQSTTLPRIVLFYREGVLVDGHKGVVDCRDNEIVLRIGKDKVRIVGDKLVVKAITPDQIYVRGKIFSVGAVKNE